MILFDSHTDGSNSDLEAFRLVGPFSGKFKSLTARKKGVPTVTHVVFENLTLVLHNLNLGYSGEGPSCLEQILFELGATREAAAKTIHAEKEFLAVEKCDAERLRRDRTSITGQLGDDLFTVAAVLRD